MQFSTAITRTIYSLFTNGRNACPKAFDFRGMKFEIVGSYELNEKTVVFNYNGRDAETGTGYLLSISVAYDSGSYSNLGTALYDAKVKLYCAATFGDDPEVITELNGIYAEQFCDYPEFIKHEDPKRAPEPKEDSLFGVPAFITYIDSLSNR